MDHDQLQRLKKAIEESPMTANQASLKVSTNSGLISDILLGRSGNPRIKTIQDICNLLNVSVSHILTGEEIINHDTQSLGIITSGQELRAASPQKVRLPGGLPNVSHLEAYTMGDNSMVLAGIPNQATVFARPLWHYRTDWPENQQYQGDGTIYITKTRKPRGEISYDIRQMTINPTGQLILSPRSMDQTYQPTAFQSQAKCSMDQPDPAPDSVNTPHIYAIVEAAQSRYIP